MRLNAALFGPREAFSVLKALLVVLFAFAFIFPLVFVSFGGWGLAVAVWVPAMLLVARLAWKRRRRKQ